MLAHSSTMAPKSMRDQPPRRRHDILAPCGCVERFRAVRIVWKK
jgi:hypothetical protein